MLLSFFAEENAAHVGKMQLLTDQVASAKNEVELLEDQSNQMDVQSKKLEQELKNLKQELEMKQVSME